MGDCGRLSNARPNGTPGRIGENATLLLRRKVRADGGLGLVGAFCVRRGLASSPTLAAPVLKQRSDICGVVGKPRS